MSSEKIDSKLADAKDHMHTYTCAEAALQTLLQHWGIDNPELTWAMAGYLGAVMSGETTCGLLIGSTAAIGFKCGEGRQSTPDKNTTVRGNAIEAVGELFSSFKQEFGSTQCKTISKVDFSDGEQLATYLMEKKWVDTCDIFLEFILRKLNEMEKAGKIC
ncbi:C_GCAxxG_C_C family protein [Candidatus Thorarchaeota archaeon]|nr:MAG: C_GCAxxG_C_C family protein [Candidatus Thorarchaeota archaeon]